MDQLNKDNEKTNMARMEACLLYTSKCSHTFNVLDARGAISVSERTNYIGRVRNLARIVAAKYIEQRKEMDYPLIKKEGLINE